jgi:membrane-bound lytic murein transglycosylase B
VFGIHERTAAAALSLTAAMLAATAALLLPAAAPPAFSPRALVSGLAAIPPRYLAWYQAAARTCPGLRWEVLAGIGTMESDNGRSRARGVHHGRNRKGAEGPMQFEPATFREYAVRADRSARLTPYDPKDAIFSAARMLCADGARGGTRKGVRGAIFAYNHAHWYVRDVLAIAARYTAAARALSLKACRAAWHHRHHRHYRHHGNHRHHGRHGRGDRRRGARGWCG